MEVLVGVALVKAVEQVTEMELLIKVLMEVLVELYLVAEPEAVVVVQVL